MTKKLYKMMNWPVIEEIIYSESQDPHATLGPHVQGNGTLIQAFFPGAQKVTLQLTKDMAEKEMELADDDGFFAVWLPVKNVGAYRYIVSYENGSVETCLLYTSPSPRDTR